MNWQCCLAGSSKTAPTILIFSIVMGSDYSFELISFVHWVPQFFMHNKSILGGVPYFGFFNWGTWGCYEINWNGLSERDMINHNHYWNPSLFLTTEQLCKKWNRAEEILISQFFNWHSLLFLASLILNWTY